MCSAKKKNSAIQIDPQLLFETLPVGLVIIDSETRRILVYGLKDESPDKRNTADGYDV